MESIRNYEEEQSAVDRPSGAAAAWNVALERPWTGAGFGASQTDLYSEYFPRRWCVVHQEWESREIHSSPFQLLADHGLIAFALYWILIGSCFLSLRKLEVEWRDVPERSWVRRYAGALRGSLIAYAVSGAFLPRAYFYLFYYVVVAAVLLKDAARNEPLVS